jgi:large subunit ribosomal protein L4
MKSMNISGKELTVEVNPALFELKYSPLVVAQAVRVFLSNQRQGTAKVKTRGEVDRTKKKWFKQKHTGNARHGARSAPIFVGGGVSHGPTGNANWKLSMSKKMRDAALQTAFALQAKEDNIMVVDGLEKIGNKTKEVSAFLKATGVGEKKILIVTETTLPGLIRASANIGTVLCTRVDRLNTYEVMSAHKLLISANALSALEARFSKKEAPVATQKVKAVKKVTKAVTQEKKTAVKKVVKKTTKKEAKA